MLANTTFFKDLLVKTYQIKVGELTKTLEGKKEGIPLAEAAKSIGLSEREVRNALSTTHTKNIKITDKTVGKKEVPWVNMVTQQ